MVKLKKTNELTNLDEILDRVVEGEAKEVIEEEVKEREGEEIARHIVDTVVWMLGRWKVEGLVKAEELVEVTVERKVYEARWFEKDTAVVYILTVKPKKGRNLHSKVVDMIVGYIKEKEEEDERYLVDNNVIFRIKTETVIMEQYYYYKQLKIYIFCF